LSTVQKHGRGYKIPAGHRGGFAWPNRWFGEQD
jgi:hypothetical protein